MGNVTHSPCPEKSLIRGLFYSFAVAEPQTTGLSAGSAIWPRVAVAVDRRWDSEVRREPTGKRVLVPRLARSRMP